jgi:tyrosine-specific transport protein
MPVMMVWIGRYYLKFPDDNRTPGGKPLLVIVCAFFVCALALETLIHSGHICSIFQACQDFAKAQMEGGI